MSDARKRFTPGPWQKRGFGAYIPNTHKRIADAALAWKTSDECEANAALIAAAPDLYEALRLMLSHGERCNWFADSGDDEVCAKAIAALAKARGEPHE